MKERKKKKKEHKIGIRESGSLVVVGSKEKEDGRKVVRCMREKASKKYIV